MPRYKHSTVLVEPKRVQPPATLKRTRASAAKARNQSETSSIGFTRSKKPRITSDHHLLVPASFDPDSESEENLPEGDEEEEGLPSESDEVEKQSRVCIGTTSAMSQSIARRASQHMSQQTTSSQSGQKHSEGVPKAPARRQLSSVSGNGVVAKSLIRSLERGSNGSQRGPTTTESPRSQTSCFQPLETMIASNSFSESQRKGFNIHSTQIEKTSQIASLKNNNSVGKPHNSTLVRASTVENISEGVSHNGAPTTAAKNSTLKSSNRDAFSAGNSRPLWNQGSSTLESFYEVDHEVNNVMLESDLLWDGVSRRDSSQVSSERHEPIVRACEIYLKALILSGQAGCELTAWPEIYRVWFSKTMGRAWVSMTKTMGTTPGRRDIGVDSRPTAFEARKFYDSFGTWRYRFMDKVRSLVQSEFEWQSQTTLVDTQRYVEKLLVNDNFACPDPMTANPSARFCADIIADVIAQCVYGTRRSGIASQPYTKDLFDPLPVKIIVLGVVAVGHAIREYESGQKRVSKFDGTALAASWRRVERTWNNQSTLRQDTIRTILLNRVQRQTRNNNDETVESAPVLDPFAESIDDLPLTELDDVALARINRVSQSPTPGPSEPLSPSGGAFKSTDVKRNFRKSPDNARDDEFEEDIMYAVLVKEKGKQDIQFYARWDCEFLQFRTLVTVTEEQKIWYNNGHDVILDDEDGYSKYKEWALTQAENGDVELTITNGFCESEDDH